MAAGLSRMPTAHPAVLYYNSRIWHQRTLVNASCQKEQEKAEGTIPVAAGEDNPLVDSLIPWARRCATADTRLIVDRSLVCGNSVRTGPAFV